MLLFILLVAAYPLISMFGYLGYLYLYGEPKSEHKKERLVMALVGWPITAIVIIIDNAFKLLALPIESFSIFLRKKILKLRAKRLDHEDIARECEIVQEEDLSQIIEKLNKELENSYEEKIATGHN